MDWPGGAGLGRYKISNVNPAANNRLTIHRHSRGRRETEKANLGGGR